MYSLSDIKGRLFIRATLWDNARYGKQDIVHNG